VAAFANTSVDPDSSLTGPSLVADIESKLAIAKQQLEQKQEELEQLRSVASGGVSNSSGGVKEGILISFDDSSTAAPIAAASAALSSAPFASKMTDACLQALCNYCRVLIASHNHPPSAAYSLANQVLPHSLSFFSFVVSSGHLTLDVVAFSLHCTSAPLPVP
jgi:hypothetical protein